MSPSKVSERQAQVLFNVQADIAMLKHTVGTLILWIGQSPNTPLSRLEVKQLLELLGKADDDDGA